MNTYTAILEGQSPIVFGAPVESVKREKENHDAHEERTWRERARVDDDGQIMMIPEALKNCLANASKYLSEKIRGQGQKTYTAKFMAGVMIVDPLLFEVTRENVEKLRLFVPSDGKSGGTKRVWKNFPMIKKWTTKATIHVLDEVITKDLLKRYLERAGVYVGLGSFRPQTNSWHGRFSVSKLKEEK